MDTKLGGINYERLQQLNIGSSSAAAVQSSLQPEMSAMLRQVREALVEFGSKGSLERLKYMQEKPEKYASIKGSLDVMAEEYRKVTGKTISNEKLKADAIAESVKGLDKLKDASEFTQKGFLEIAKVGMKTSLESYETTKKDRQRKEYLEKAGPTFAGGAYGFNTAVGGAASGNLNQMIGGISSMVTSIGINPLMGILGIGAELASVPLRSAIQNWDKAYNVGVMGSMQATAGTPGMWMGSASGYRNPLSQFQSMQQQYNIPLEQVQATYKTAFFAGGTPLAGGIKGQEMHQFLQAQTVFGTSATEFAKATGMLQRWIPDGNMGDIFKDSFKQAAMSGQTGIFGSGEFYRTQTNLFSSMAYSSYRVRGEEDVKKIGEMLGIFGRAGFKGEAGASVAGEMFGGIRGLLKSPVTAAVGYNAFGFTFGQMVNPGMAQIEKFFDEYVSGNFTRKFAGGNKDYARLTMMNEIGPGFATMAEYYMGKGVSWKSLTGKEKSELKDKWQADVNPLGALATSMQKMDAFQTQKAVTKTDIVELNNSLSRTGQDMVRISQSIQQGVLNLGSMLANPLMAMAKKMLGIRTTPQEVYEHLNNLAWFESKGKRILDYKGSSKNSVISELQLYGVLPPNVNPDDFTFSELREMYKKNILKKGDPIKDNLEKGLNRKALYESAKLMAPPEKLDAVSNTAYGAAMGMSSGFPINNEMTVIVNVDGSREAIKTTKTTNKIPSTNPTITGNLETVANRQISLR